MKRGRQDVAGKTCVITGAASGIGRATALEAAKRGAKVVLTDLAAEGLEETAALVRSRGGTVLDVRALDVTDHEAVAAWAADVHAAHGPADVVMNIAGVSTWGAVDTLRHSDWRKMVEVNLMGPIGVIEAFVPEMVRAGRGGHLVNVSSAAGLLGLPLHAAYSASKFGLRGVSEVLRFDLAKDGIGVSLVCPGGVDTPLVQTVDIVGVDKDHPKLKKMTDRFRRHAVSPETVAKAILRGVERRRYLVYTSPDIWAGFLLQRYVPPVYELIMHLLQWQMRRVVGAAAKG